MQGLKRETATLGGGCFWCLEAVFQDLEGVERVVSGYAGGTVPNPGYREVCGGRTGHAEVVQVTFDPAVLSYGELLSVFFSIHDPTTMNRQGNDVGTQYRSVVLTHDPEQQRVAETMIRELAAAGIWKDPLVTEVVPLTHFYPAEQYHQNYFRENPGQGYCRVVIEPKLRKFRESFRDRVKQGTAGS
jgi:peptide-methionine (S)-S-oxide reductase